MCNFSDFQRANDVALFFDDSLGKIAAQKLSDVDPDGVAVLEGICRSYRRLAHQNRPIGFDHFQLTNALVVIAENFYQDVAGRSWRKQNVIRLKFARIVRDQVFRFRSFELKPATERARTTPQVSQIHFAVVME